MTSRFTKTRKSKAASIAAFATLALAAACAAIPYSLRAEHTETKSPHDSASAALCPVVYPDDQSPESRGYHYTFFGNAFWW